MLGKCRSVTLLLSVFLLSFVAGLVSWSSDAYAIKVSLKRIVFENSKRSEILTIINNTEQEQTYRLGWRKYRMDEKKGLRAIAEGEPSNDILWADKMVRFAPRRVTIPAGGSEQVRLLFRSPADFREVEYRSHLSIVSEIRSEELDKDQQGQQSVRLAVQPAISLPVFVRNGNLAVTASIEDASLTKGEDNNLTFSFVLTREGARSIYGDMDFVCSAGDKDIVLHRVRGISVYTEINKRYMSFDIPLDTPEKQGCNNVTVRYRADPEDPQQKGATLAQGSAQF
ncbi:MAG: hypothetical protein DHS20C02_19990 [Micavibrio sp.]|nr:MAG: hypothetical protein DHS20C02_19990 [Micavibrio sp.]